MKGVSHHPGFDAIAHQGVRAKGDPIHIKASHKGELHRDLDVPAGEPIPAAKLQKAEHSKNPAIRKRANFAANAKKWGK